LLQKRADLQSKLDDCYRQNAGTIQDMDAYKDFLKEIGYLVDATEKVQVTTQNVDPEITDQAGPQLVVPIMNARYALNALNARWGSLYDALYGTDAISEDDGAEITAQYNPVRGAKVIAYARQLDRKSTRLNSSHVSISYAVFCLK